MPSSSVFPSLCLLFSAFSSVPLSSHSCHLCLIGPSCLLCSGLQRTALPLLTPSSARGWVPRTYSAHDDSHAFFALSLGFEHSHMVMPAFPSPSMALSLGASLVSCLLAMVFMKPLCHGSSPKQFHQPCLLIHIMSLTARSCAFHKEPIPVLHPLT